MGGLPQGAHLETLPRCVGGGWAGGRLRAPPCCRLPLAAPVHAGPSCCHSLQEIPGCLGEDDEVFLASGAPTPGPPSPQHCSVEELYELLEKLGR